MHFGAHFLQPFLVRHAEMLFLVDDEKAQLLEGDPTMSTDPSAIAARVAFASLVETKRDRGRTEIGKPRKRSAKLR